MLYNIHELKIGLKVIQNKEPCIIIENECVKPGKGLSFNRLRFRKIKSGQILERTLKSGEFLESANIVETKYIYLYRDNDMWFFMDNKSFDQIAIQSEVLGQSMKWMQEQVVYTLTFWNNSPILVMPPEIMQLQIIKTTPVIKGASFTVSHGSKLAMLSTGAIVKVPFFIQIGEIIKVNTSLATYISRK